MSNQLRPNFAKAAREANMLIERRAIKYPPVDPVEIAESLGLSVSQIEMPEKFSNVSGFMDFKNEEIVINKNQSERKKRFAIAHEIGHFILHSSIFEKNSSLYAVQFLTDDVDTGDTVYEREASQFATNLLAPDSLLKTYKDVPKEIKATIFGTSEKLLQFRKQHFK